MRLVSGRIGVYSLDVTPSVGQYLSRGDNHGHDSRPGDLQGGI